jgi:hypothetical protein
MIVKRWAFGWLAINKKIVRDTSLATTQKSKALPGGRQLEGQNRAATRLTVLVM